MRTLQMKLLNSVVIMAVMGFQAGTAQAQGIPVIDAAAILKYGEQIIQMKEQIDNQISQITELKNQVKALTGGREMGNLLKDTVKDQIPDEWSDIYKMVNIDTSNLTDPKKYDPEANLKMLASIQKMTETAFADTKKRQGNIDGLTQALNNTTDIKAAADLQGRIAAEQATIANNQTKLDQMARMAVIQQKVNDEQRWSYEMCTIDAMIARKDGADCR